MRRVLPVLLLLTACGPHRQESFFAPLTPGTLVAPWPTVRCGRAWAVEVEAPASGRPADLLDLGACPNRTWLAELVREEAQRVPLTAAEAGSFRLVIAPDGTDFWTGDGQRTGWTTDGYTILTNLYCVREALSGAFSRGALLP